MKELPALSALTALAACLAAPPAAARWFTFVPRTPAAPTNIAFDDKTHCSTNRVTWEEQLFRGEYPSEVELWRYHHGGHGWVLSTVNQPTPGGGCGDIRLNVPAPTVGVLFLRRATDL